MPTFGIGFSSGSVWQAWQLKASPGPFEIGAPPVKTVRIKQLRAGADTSSSSFAAADLFTTLTWFEKISIVSMGCSKASGLGSGVSSGALSRLTPAPNSDGTLTM